MRRVLVVLLSCACACASSSPGVSAPPPPYSESRATSDASFKQLLKYLDSPIASPEQRNFAIFALAVDTISQSIADGNDYEHAYSVADMVLKLAEIAPDAARTMVLKNVSKVLETEKLMTKLIDEVCYPGSAVGTSGHRCDELVHSLVQRYPWYQPYATVLLDAGGFGHIFNKNQADIEAAVEQNKVQEYLEYNKHDLKPLMFQISKLLNLEKRLNGVVV